MGKIYAAIDALLRYAEKNLYLPQKDVDYARNGILELLGLDAYSSEMSVQNVDDETPERLLDELTAECVSMGLFQLEQAEYYRDGIMAQLMLSPSRVQSVFEDKFNSLGSAARASATAFQLAAV